MSKYVGNSPKTEKYEPEITTYLDTFQAVQMLMNGLKNERFQTFLMFVQDIQTDLINGTGMFL